jgi:hypothetical protein
MLSIVKPLNMIPTVDRVENRVPLFSGVVVFVSSCRSVSCSFFNTAEQSDTQHSDSTGRSISSILASGENGSTDTSGLRY